LGTWWRLARPFLINTFFFLFHAQANFGKIAKWGLVGFNVFFLLAGLAILAASIYYYITQPLIQDFSIGTCNK